MNNGLTEISPGDTPLGPGKRRGLLLGAHLSVASGLENALHSAVQLGCDCVQIFVKNQRQWRAPLLRNEQIERFRAAQSATHVAPVVAHASYLLNLASPDNRARLGSVRALTDELERCEALGSPSTSQEEVARAIAELEGAPPLQTWGHESARPSSSRPN